MREKVRIEAIRERKMTVLENTETKVRVRCTVNCCESVFLFYFVDYFDVSDNCRLCRGHIRRWAASKPAARSEAQGSPPASSSTTTTATSLLPPRSAPSSGGSGATGPVLLRPTNPAVCRLVLPPSGQHSGGRSPLPANLRTQRHGFRRFRNG